MTWLIRFCRDGSTIFINRLTGHRFTLAPAHGSSVFCYLNGQRIGGLMFRREAVEYIDQFHRAWLLVRS